MPDPFRLSFWRGIFSLTDLRAGIYYVEFIIFINCIDYSDAALSEEGSAGPDGCFGACRCWAQSGAVLRRGGAIGPFFCPPESADSHMDV